MRATGGRKWRGWARWLSFNHLSKGRRRLAQSLLAILILIFILTPLAMTGASAYQVYEHIRQLGQDGMTHLLDAKNLFMKTSDNNSTSCSAISTPSASPQSTASTQGSPTPGATATPTSLLPGGLNTGSFDLKALTDKNKLNQAYQDFISAESDFVQLNNELNSHPTLLGLAKALPGYAKEATEAKQIAQAGIEISSLAAEVT